MCHLPDGQEFDAVIACDNALPHLLSDERILQALREFHRCTAPGGVCLVSLRDYGVEERQGVQSRAPVVHDAGGVRHIVFQVREFQGSVYDLNLYLIEDEGGTSPTLRVFRSRYYAVTTDVLCSSMRRAGFVDVERLDDAYYQPLIVGRRFDPGGVSP